jgi:anhydro-N-acetylmuramic acid kinase
MEPIWAVGLMTGTVLDGNVDVAMLRTDGETIAELGPFALKPYPRDVRDLIGEAVEAARAWRFEGPEPAIFGEAERALTLAQAEAVAEFLYDNAIAPADVGIVGLHGQTVLHRAPAPGRLGATRQLGDGQVMADRLGIPVAFDFRSADVAAGGQGAPLAPIYHRALLARTGNEATAAILNLGGVGNVTALAPDGGFVAFDTGPANGPVNDWVRRHTGAEMDRDGALAAQGRPDEAVIARHLAHPYFAAPPPKSLDRYDFTADMAEGLSPADGAATLTHFAAAAAARALEHLPARPERLVVCGGGRRNPSLMAALHARTGLAVVDADALGLRGDAVEAELFALLAVRALRGLPISFPSTTGAPRPLSGGRLARPQAD